MLLFLYSFFFPHGDYFYSHFPYFPYFPHFLGNLENCLNYLIKPVSMAIFGNLGNWNSYGSWLNILDLLKVNFRAPLGVSVAHMVTYDSRIIGKESQFDNILFVTKPTVNTTKNIKPIKQPLCFFRETKQQYYYNYNFLVINKNNQHTTMLQFLV